MQFSEDWPHIAIRYTVSATATADPQVVFDKNEGGTISANTQNGIVYDPNNGRFYAAQNGFYYISYNITVVPNATGAIDDFEIRRNGTIIWDGANILQLTNGENLQLQAQIITYMNDGDYIDCMINSNGANTLRIRTGSILNMFKIA